MDHTAVESTGFSTRERSRYEKTSLGAMLHQAMARPPE